MNFILDTGLVLYLPLYECDGASILSRDARGHTCTVTGALWRPDGRYFDGTDDKINCGNNPALQTGQSITLMAWLRPNLEGQLMMPLATGTWGSPGGWVLELKETGKLRFTYDSVAGGHTYATLSTDSLADGVWRCTGFRIEGTDFYYFFDGSLDDNQTLGYGGVEDGTNDFTIGTDTGGGYKYSGIIGELLVYNRPLTAAECQNIYLTTKWRYQ